MTIRKLIVVLAALGAAPALGYDPAPGAASASQSTSSTSTSPERDEKAREYFTDLPVVDQHGERKRFFSDVLKNKLVLISFFYTSCTAACPLINQKLAAVQDLLGERLGKDVFMISLTTDPENDTPEVLKSYAARFGARDGWVFLTGAKTDVKKILDRLGNVFPVREQHLTYLILGDVAAARWRKIQANIPEEAIAGWVTALADERE